MKPKDKAKELFDKYVELSGIYVGDYESEKEMCLIAVDEILKAIPDSLLDVWQGETYLCENDDINYWKKVKKEIEKL